MIKEKKNAEKYNSIRSILIIISYFMLPYLILSITKSQIVNSIFYILYGVLLIFLYWDTFKNDFKDILKNKKKYLKIIILNVILLLFVVIITNVVINAILNTKVTTENEYSLLNIFKTSPFVLILLTCIYYPIIEGIVFRKTVRDIIDNKWLFIIFSSLFYFFFNIVYTSMSLNNILVSICYFFSMVILSKHYWETNNFVSSVIILVVYNLLVSILSFI